MNLPHVEMFDCHGKPIFMVSNTLTDEQSAFLKLG